MIRTLVHFHSFAGSLAAYRRWILFSPSTVFGVSAATMRASQDDFATTSELSKLVLESDAPFLRSKGRRHLPHDLLDAAIWLARHKGLHVRAVLGATAHNAAHFYGMRLQ